MGVTLEGSEEMGKHRIMQTIFTGKVEPPMGIILSFEVNLGPERSVQTIFKGSQEDYTPSPRKNIIF